VVSRCRDGGTEAVDEDSGISICGFVRIGGAAQRDRWSDTIQAGPWSLMGRAGEWLTDDFRGPSSETMLILVS
jgi:hypothetical protein